MALSLKIAVSEPNKVLCLWAIRLLSRRIASVQFVIVGAGQTQFSLANGSQGVTGNFAPRHPTMHCCCYRHVAIVKAMVGFL